MKRQSLIFMTGLLLVMMVASVFQPATWAPEQDLAIIEDEMVPLGAIGSFASVFNSGYGVTWSLDGLSSAPLYRGTMSTEQIATLYSIGKTMGSTALADSELNVVGMSRQTAESFIGSPAVFFGTTNIGKLSTNTKAYYKIDQDLIILYFDNGIQEGAQAGSKSGSKVLFALRLTPELARQTQFMTRIAIADTGIADTEMMTLALINNVREAYGKMPLTYLDPLATVSRSHSQSMVTGNYFSHTNLQGQGAKERLKAFKVPYKTFGEALTAGNYTPMDVVTAWMNSPGHRAILLGDYQMAGLGLAMGSAKYGIYFTLMCIN